MPKLSVYFTDQAVAEIDKEVERSRNKGDGPASRSAVVHDALVAYFKARSRAHVSSRGRTETLRATRAARQALLDLEATLTQEAPVKRRVRRV